MSFLAPAFSGQSNTASLSYDAVGRRTGISHSAGITGTFAFDNADRLTSLGWSGSPAISEALSYTSAGNIKQIVREMGTFNYGYTPKSEVASISYSGAETLSNAYVNTNLTYDGAGNIVQYRGIGFQNFNNFMTDVGSISYRPSSDGLGRVQNTWGTLTLPDYRYYPEGQLKKFRLYDPAVNALQRTVDYYYDGLGRRIAKVVIVPGDTTTYLNYSHLGADDKNLFATYKKGSTFKEVLYADGQSMDDHLFEISSDTGVKVYKTDHLGSAINSSAVGGKSVYGLWGENLGVRQRQGQSNFC